MDDDQTTLVQVQQDRFVRNWRKANAKPYPRYESIRQSFRDQFEAFRRFVDEQGVGPCVPNQCEITYVNHIPWGREGQPPQDLSKVLAIWSPSPPESFLGTEETVDLAARYVIRSADGPIGRLHVSAGHRYRNDDMQPLLALTLTARGQPTSEGIDDMMTFFDVGREHIVRGFAAITTPEMHRRWRRRA